MGAPADRSEAWEVYDRPELQDAVTAPLPGGTREAVIGLDGLHCAACVARVEKLLSGAARNVRASLASRTVQFAFDPRAMALSKILQQLDAAGLRPQVLAQDSGLRAQASERRTALARIGVAVLCSMQVMMLAWPSYTDGADVAASIDALLRWSQWLIATPCVFYAGWPFLAGAAQALRQRVLNMDVPVALSLLIAYGASAWRTLAGSGEIYFDTATMFVLFLLVGRFLEQRTHAVAVDRLRLLAGRRSLTATRIENGKPVSVPVGALVPGDEISVAPGETVPVDGKLLSASADLDESLLSGESRPVHRRLGESVLAGSLNADVQSLRLHASSVGAATRLSQIMRLLQQAQQERPAFQVLADRIAAHFILTVLALAAIGAGLWWGSDSERAISVALAVLVASCPCALSLALPVALGAASSRLASLGVLVARPRALARAARIDVVLFDKTGTLTHAQLGLRQVHAFAQFVPAECVRIAAALERSLPHPIARAFNNVPMVSTAENVRLEPGGGVSGRVGRRSYRLGPVGRIESLPADAVRVLSAAGSEGHTWIALSDDKGLLALFGLAARERPEAAEVVGELKRAGIRVELLSGDDETAARSLASRVGIDAVHARQTPEQKLARLQALQGEGHVVMAVGDGINDAPFLAAADVAVAMPAGAALAQARADLVLVGDSLSGLLDVRNISAAAQRRVRQNIAWALGYNLSVLPLAMTGLLAPWIAALGMSLSSLLVVANALRLPQRPPPAPVTQAGAVIPLRKAA